MKKYRNAYIYDYDLPCIKSILRSIAHRGGYAYDYDIIKALKRNYSEDEIKDCLHSLQSDNRVVVKCWTKSGQYWREFQINTDWLT